ncbi:MAG: DUF4166 domain-containing protein [Pseudomonadota bacterium]
MNSSANQNQAQRQTGDVWFVYDGDCSICCMAAEALQIKKSVGDLHLVDARHDQQHPLVAEINALGLDLDEGMVLKFQDRHYHGRDALHLMALLGSAHGGFNRMNALLFRSKFVARLCYPFMRAMRNFLLRMNGIAKIRNLERALTEPIFQTALGDDWHAMPEVMRRRFGVRPYSNDQVKIEGKLNIQISPLLRLLSRISGILVPYQGNDVPVTVRFISGPDSSAFMFDRTFCFPGKEPVSFRSCMHYLKGNEFIETMRFGLSWRFACEWNGTRIALIHRGYAWRILGFNIPIPLTALLGKAEAEETPESEHEFSMWVHAVHPWFGKPAAYAGRFTITAETSRA